MNFEGMKVEELRSILVQSGNFTEETAFAVKGKANVVYEIRKLEEEGKIILEPESVESDNQIDDLLNNAEMIKETFIAPEGAEEPYARVRRVTDDDWQDYVMSQLLPEEFYKDNPKVAGLRRVAEKVLGEIIFSGPIQVFASTNDIANGRASVLYKLEIAWMVGTPAYAQLEHPSTRVFQACAEAWDGNVKAGIYQTFPLTIAETRAEGRALRKALHLRNVVTAEEMNDSTEMPESTPVVQEWDENEKASSQQLSSIKMMCDRLNVDISKLVVVTKQDAVNTLRQLNLYQGGDLVPENLKLETK